MHENFLVFIFSTGIVFYLVGAKNVFFKNSFRFFLPKKPTIILFFWKPKPKRFLTYNFFINYEIYAK